MPRWWGPKRKGSALEEIQRTRAEERPAPQRVQLEPMVDLHGDPVPTFQSDQRQLNGRTLCARCHHELREHGPDLECPA